MIHLFRIGRAKVQCPKCLKDVEFRLQMAPIVYLIPILNVLCIIFCLLVVTIFLFIRNGFHLLKFLIAGILVFPLSDTIVLEIIYFFTPKRMRPTSEQIYERFSRGEMKVLCICPRCNRIFWISYSKKYWVGDYQGDADFWLPVVVHEDVHTKEGIDNGLS